MLIATEIVKVKFCSVISARAFFGLTSIGRPAAAAGVPGSEMVTWVKPVSFADPTGSWSSEASAYDGDVATYASATAIDNPLVLILDEAIRSSSVRIEWSTINTDPYEFYADIYDVAAAAWVRVIEDVAHVQNGSPYPVLEAFFTCRVVNKIRVYAAGATPFFLREVDVGRAYEMGVDSISAAPKFAGSIATQSKFDAVVTGQLKFAGAISAKKCVA